MRSAQQISTDHAAKPVFESNAAADARYRAFARTESRRNETGILALCALSGAALSLSAPGFDQWYLAWVGVVPLFVLIFAASSGREAFLRSFVFGTAYNLVYLHFILTLKAPMVAVPPLAAAVFWWLVCSTHQGIVFGIFGLILRKIPLTCHPAPEKIPQFDRELKLKEVWHLPVMLIAPALWVLMLNKVGNSPLVLGIPWTMLEYSQYQNVELIQIAKIFGGIGVGALIIAVNVAVFSVCISLSKRFADCRVIPYRSKTTAGLASLAMVFLLMAVTSYGKSCLTQAADTASRSITVSILQGNLTSKAHGARPRDVAERYLNMCAKAPPGLCLWTEWALPLHLAEQKSILDGLIAIARDQKQTWLVGALERGDAQKSYNSVCALHDGKLAEPVYRKRLLVPFLEHMPGWMADPGLKDLLNIAPGRIDLQPGSAPNVMKLNTTSIGALVCLEVVSPELVCQSVRDGADILTDLSNTTWFHSTTAGRHMIAQSALRAAETSRTTVFSTTTGPSAIIDPNGRILEITQPNTVKLVSKTVPLATEITPFVRWFR